jgi:hypothetical protein
LTSEEIEFKKLLEAKSVGMAAVQKAKARQHTRLTWIKDGDSNTRLFHIYANARRKKKFICALNTEDGIATNQQEKIKVAVDYFSKAVGSSMIRSRRINWNALGYTPFNLEDLDLPFTMQELLETVKALPAEKAPGPDGFIGIFYKKSWEIIKHDLYEALMGFYNQNTSKMQLFNEANIVLLPGKRRCHTHNRLPTDKPNQ